jgi:phosphate transport system protein
MANGGDQGSLEREVALLFSLVSEALAGATDALLAAEPDAASRVVAADESVDALTAQLSTRIWEDFDRLAPANDELRHLVGLLAVLPELERSADLAAHIAQRGVTNLGPSMSPVSRGIVQRMSDVALEMWREVTTSYVSRTAAGIALDEHDEELDILLERLTNEVAGSAMPAQVAAQVTLLGRFYERLGDHAVNLARRIELLPGVGSGGGKD